MNRIQRAALILLTYILLTTCIEIDTDNEITVEDEKDDLKLGTINDDVKEARILRPYPLNLDKKNEVDESDRENEKNRKARFLLPNPVLNMWQTITHKQPTSANDLLDFLRDSYPLPKGYSAPLEEYDYIIVGAGSAGSVLASRLSEDKPKAMVLLLESGKPESLFSDIPALVSYLQLSDYTWKYSTEPQKDVCLGSEKHRCFTPRGHAVGGTSVVNYMIYSRGRRIDWDRIAADGNYGWSYEEVLKYYKKSERANLKHKHNPFYHGQDGELNVENVSFRTRLLEAFLEAGRSTGSPTIDYNAPDDFGFGYVQTTTRQGHRMSAAKAFLHPHKRRRNLHILPESTVTKVIIEPTSKRAYAVEYIRNGITYRARTRREIILSAGPIASPQLLMLSGVGPREHLESLGIPVIQDLRVGRNLYDHICFPGAIFKLDTQNISLFESKIATVPNFIEWMQFGEGLLTSIGGVEGIGFIKTPVSDDPELHPDIELISMGSSLNIDSGTTFIKSFGLKQVTYDSAYSSLNGRDTWSAIPMLLHPKSKGYIELRDKNPLSYPKIVANYLTDRKDLETFVAAIKHIIRLGETEAFIKYGAKLHLGQYHTCPTLAPGSDEYWECAVRTMMVSLFHQIATCKMGPPTDPDAVVDPELRVYGIGGLRVVDSSIIPRTISAHTNAPAIMIGEKAADLIKNTWANVV